MAKPSSLLWVWYMLQFDNWQPTTEKFLQFRWHHYHFLKRKDINITASAYLETLIEDIRKALVKDMSNYLKRLILHSFLDALANPATRKEIVAFFDREEIFKETIMGLQERINELRNPLVDVKEEDRGDDLYAKTYVVATHLHFELAGKEAEYESLTRQIPHLEQFIRETFKTGKLPGTLSKFRGYSYKKILKGKSTGEKGQLKPAFRQIIDNPQIFGEPLVRRAEQILQEEFD